MKLKSLVLFLSVFASTIFISFPSYAGGIPAGVGRVGGRLVPKTRVNFKPSEIPVIRKVSGQRGVRGKVSAEEIGHFFGHAAGHAVGHNTSCAADHNKCP